MKASSLVLVACTLLATTACGRSDAAFVERVHSGGMLEVELGRHAMRHASDPRVREFAEKMVIGHAAVIEELAEVAARENLWLPEALKHEDAQTADRITEITGVALDRAYMKEMVEAHGSDIEDFRAQGRGRDDRSAVARWAASKVPVLQEQLADARHVRHSLGDVALAR